MGQKARGKRQGARGKTIYLASNFLLLTSCFLLLAIPLALAADPPKTKGEVAKKEKQLESLRKEIVEKKKGLGYNNKSEHSILEDLERLDMALDEKEEERAAIEKSMSQLKQKGNNVDIHIRGLTRERERLSQLLERRLAAMYKMKKGGVMQPLFSSGSVNDFGRRYKYINKVIDYDAALLMDYRENQLLLETEKDRLKEFEQETLSLKNMVEQKKAELAQEEDKKKALLKDVRKKKDIQLAAIHEMESASKKLQLFIYRLKKDTGKDETDAWTTGFASMRGYLPMPVNGKIVSMYGKVEHPKFHTITFNNGVEIEAAAGTEVKSVYKGQVAYSGWFRGYGKVMIIDHGNGYYTLFGRLSKIMKDVDSVVEKGDVLALVGDTGSIKGPHLYFEVRQKGVPLDPLNWLADNK